MRLTAPLENLVHPLGSVHSESGPHEGIVEGADPIGGGVQSL